MRITQWFGFNPPFLTESEVLPPQTDIRLIKNDILQLLLTGLKERVMRPNFGTPIRTTPFEPDDSFTAGNLRNQVFQAIETSESRVGVRDVIINSNPDSNNMTVTVLVYLRSDPNRTVFPIEAEFVAPKGNFGSTPIRSLGVDNG
tara:strand:+ start:26322 stop:26756 length:435 start_codon:yes stop_codon:yes gene_type:complete